MMIYNPNIDLVNDNVYTKFGLNKSIRSQDIERKLNSDVNQGRNSCANLRKMTLYNTNVEHVNDNVYTKSGQILSIHCQDIGQKLNSDANQGP